MGARRDLEDLPRPVVTLEGAPPVGPPADVLDAERPPASPCAVAEGVVRRGRAVLGWSPRRDVLRPLVAAATAVLVAGATGALALELRAPSTDPRDVLAATVGAGSFRMDIRSELVRRGSSGASGEQLGVDSRAVFDVDLRDDASRFRLSPGVEGHTSFEVVVIGPDTWTRFVLPEGVPSGVPGLPGADRPWTRTDTGERPGLSPLDTEGGLGELLERATVVEELDDAEVDGDPVAEVVIEIPSDPDEDGRDVLGTSADAVRATMSVDGEGRLRRLVSEHGDDVEGRVRSTLTLSRYGDDLGIAPPPADQVTEDDALSG